jgi:flavin reductase (DIM6/NTAB) family NADH-FMN oxidoreductase RutF
MAKEKIQYTDYYREVMEVLSSRGLLLGTYDAAGKPNIMTIGWGAVGPVWGKPLWVVLVRPSRYTHDGIEKAGCFTVNVPTPEMAPACDQAGTKSGRDMDKFEALGLAVERTLVVKAPAVTQCPIIYECKVVHSNEVAPSRMARDILASAYPAGDYHSVYWGEIVAARAEKDAARRLGW